MAILTGGNDIGIRISTSADTRGLEEAQRKLNLFSESAVAASQKVLLGVGGLMTAFGGFVGFGARTAGELEAARQGFVALLGSAERADATMTRIKREAVATPFEISGLVAGTQALTAITKDGDRAIDVLLDVGRAVAISGRGQDELNRVVFNLQQISATGKVTAMDIRQFQGAIPIFNDIISAAGLTVEQLQEAENASELLFEAFRLAGAEGGVAARGFSAQAGTFNQLISNMRDNITILSSEFVRQTGIFEAIKNALAGINSVFGDQERVMALVSSAIRFLSDNGAVLAGVILGMLTPAFYGLAKGIWLTMAPLIPFMIIGAALAVLIKSISDQLGGLNGVLAVVSPVLEAVGVVFRELIIPQLRAAWEQISNSLLPALRGLWEVLEPVLIPTLRVLGVLFGAVLLGAIMTFVGAIRLVIYILTRLVDQTRTSVEAIFGFFKGLFDSLVGGSLIPDLINSIVDWFGRLPGLITGSLSGLFSAITSPFRRAFDEVRNMADLVTDKLRQISPFHRSSPSLVEDVTKGVAIIKEQFLSLKDFNVTHTQTASPVARVAPQAVGPSPAIINQTNNIYSNVDMDSALRGLVFALATK